MQTVGAELLADDRFHFQVLENKASGAEESFDSALFSLSPRLATERAWAPPPGGGVGRLADLAGLALTGLATRAKRCSWISVRPWMRVYDILCACAQPVHVSRAESLRAFCFSFSFFL